MPVYHARPRACPDRPRTPFDGPWVPSAPFLEEWTWFGDALNGRSWNDVGWEHCWYFTGPGAIRWSEGIICFDIGALAPNEYGDAPAIDFGFAVNPECQGRGLGRHMLKNLLMEFPNYIIHCDAVSPATRYLCADLGFYFQPATGPQSYVLFPEDNPWHSSCPSPAPRSTSTR